MRDADPKQPHEHELAELVRDCFAIDSQGAITKLARGIPPAALAWLDAQCQPPTTPDEPLTHECYNPDCTVTTSNRKTSGDSTASKDDMWEVCKILKPGMTRIKFDALWAEFIMEKNRRTVMPKTEGPVDSATEEQMIAHAAAKRADSPVEDEWALRKALMDGIGKVRESWRGNSGGCSWAVRQVLADVEFHIGAALRNKSGEKP